MGHSQTVRCCLGGAEVDVGNGLCMRGLTERVFDHLTPATRVLVAIGASLPFFFLILLGHGWVLAEPSTRVVVHPEVMLALQGVLVLAIALTGWVQYARTVRGSTLVERNKEYVQAARVTGVAPLRIMVRHVLPNVLGPVMVLATIQVATAIITEATLSFLGVGVPPEIPTWGTMVAGSQSYAHQAFGVVLFPGLAIIVTALSLQLVGDGVRDLLDPRLQKAL